MTIETDLLSIGGERPMPDALRARIEAKLVARAWETEPAVPELEDADDARIVPARLRARLQGTVAAVAKEALDQVDAPRALPDALRARLERSLVPSMRRRERAVRALAVAASLILIASSSVAIVRLGGGGGERAPVPVAGGPSAPSDDTTVVTVPSPGETGPDAVLLPPVAGVGSGPSGGSWFYPEHPGYEPVGPAPPYAYEPVAASLGDDSSGSGSPPPPPAAGKPFTVAAIEGDDEQVAGFRAYLKLLNSEGGVSGVHRVVTERVGGPSEAARDAMAVVNLGEQGATEPREDMRAPMFETMATAEAALEGEVFSVAGSPERQARVAVDAVFPARADGATATVYRPLSGIFASAIADAFQRALEARGVRVLEVEVADAGPIVLAPTDAAFVSLPPRLARRWVSQAEQAGYSPARGVGGIFSLGSQALAPDLPARTVVASPYELALGDQEAQDLLDRTERPLTAGLIHGWMSAKMLAIAMWHSGADTPAEMHAALRALRRWEMGFVTYGVRPGTNVRAPDARLHVVRDGKLTAEGTWRTDEG